MKSLLAYIKGDKALWAIIILFALVSFLPIYSASTNLIYVVGKGSSWYYLKTHALHIGLGLLLLYIFHLIPYGYYSRFAKIILLGLIVLLCYTAFSGTEISGADASRWIRIPIVNFSLQPSLLAVIGVMIYVASFLSKNYEKKITFNEALWQLWIPVILASGLILRSNLSTSVILFGTTVLLCFLGGHPIKYILKVCLIGVALFLLFILVVKAFPNMMPNRVDTWASRVESFVGKGDPDDTYQIERAKMAIATGGFLGKGAGKSVMKNFLPQSSSDFIYAIIVEEYGSFGACVALLFYLFLLYRMVVIAQRAESPFSKLLVIGMGLPILVQAFSNMAVAVEIFPVTGQNLPFLSHGGTSILSTCIALGIMLSVSAKRKMPIQKTASDKGEEVLHNLSQG